MARAKVSSAVLAGCTAVLLVFGTAAGCNTNGAATQGGGSAGGGGNGNAGDNGQLNGAPVGIPTSPPASSSTAGNSAEPTLPVPSTSPPAVSGTGE